MAIQTNPIIASQKRQPKGGTCAKTGYKKKSCQLNFENVHVAESTAIRDCFR